jgi:hypothetical protein
VRPPGDRRSSESCKISCSLLDFHRRRVPSVLTAERVLFQEQADLNPGSIGQSRGSYRVKNPLDFSRFRFWVLIGVIIPLAAGLLTWATGYLPILSLIGGFPFPWRELVFGQCAAKTPITPCRGPTLIPCYNCPVTYQVSYHWLSFAIDLIFNTAVGYSAILALPVVIRIVKRLYGRNE